MADMVKMTENELAGLQREIRDFWDRNARNYSMASVLEIGTDNPVNKCVRSLYPGVRKLRILDVGTGAGCTAISLALDGYSVLGIDISSEMVVQARENAERFSVDAEFMNTDICGDDLEDRQFDVVVFQDSLLTIVNSYLALENAYRLLCPGGHLIISEGNFFFEYPEYGQRKKYFKYKYGEYELQKKLYLSNVEYDALEKLVKNIRFNHARHPGWEVWVFSYLGFGTVSIRYGDDEIYKTLTEVGMSNIPLTYTIHAMKPFTDVTVIYGEPAETDPDYYRNAPSWYGVMDALCNRERIQILRALKVSPRPVHELNDLLGSAQNLTSHHLRILKDAGLVRGERSGRETVYSLVNPLLLGEFEDIMEQMGKQLL